MMTSRRRAVVLAAWLGAALSVGVLSFVPSAVPADAFVLTGSQLGLDQRDFRVNNGFLNAGANDNTTPETNYPGHTGAVLAIRKAHAEWGSGPHGDGGGDPVGGNVLGSGGANFDQSFQGTTTDVAISGNIHRVLPGTSGGTTAFVQGGAGGWQIAYYGGWVWEDGPDGDGPGFDIQGVATRLIGITLGLGNSSVPGASMHPGTAPVQVRSLEADDIAGIQAIYGVAAATKPLVTSLSGSTDVGGTLVIHGSNFSPFNNEVWLTREDSDGTPAKLLGVLSTSGGTRIEVAVPAGVEDGDLLVKNNGSGGASLSNAFPIDIGNTEGFVNLGPGLGGATGVPAFTGAGDLSPGGAGFTLEVSAGAPGATGGWFIGLDEGAAAFKGGVLYAVPWVVLVNIQLNAAGGLVVPGVVDASIPSGLDVVMQIWLHDSSGPVGFTATNGLRLDIP